MRTGSPLVVLGMLFIPTQIHFFFYAHGDIWLNYIMQYIPPEFATQKVEIVALDLSVDRIKPIALTPLTISLFLCGWWTQSRFGLFWGLLLPFLLTVHTVMIINYDYIQHRMNLEQIGYLFRRYADELLLLGTGAYLGYLSAYMKHWKKDH